MKLFSYFRSSAAYRVRIALNLKGLDYQQVAVHLLKNGGEQLAAEYRALNPAGLVPTLVDETADGSLVLNQSLAILEYLDEAYPQYPLLPAALGQRAQVRAFALDIACEIHPLNNLRVLKYLSKQLGVSEEQKNAWYQHWCMSGLQALESRLQQRATATPFCFGDQPGLADCLLIPQVFNALRFNCDLSGLPLINGIYQQANQVAAFIQAQPANQPDAE